jgi:hypothetical protein
MTDANGAEREMEIRILSLCARLESAWPTLVLIKQTDPRVISATKLTAGQRILLRSARDAITRLIEETS